MLNDFWLIVSIALLFIGLVASQGLLLVIGSLILIIWVTAKFWDRFAFRDVTHDRTLSHDRAFIGDTIDYTITLSNEKLLPLIWVDIQDPFPHGLELPGGNVRGRGIEISRDHRINTSLLPYQRVTWKYKIHCAARGYHRIGPATLRSGDMFGFTAAETSFPTVNHILVYPLVVDLKHLILPSEHPLGDTRGQRPIYEDASRFFGLRDYHPTDPMKRIDWKATARRSWLQTKVFEPVVSLNVLIALNANTGEYAWQGVNRRLFERAVTMAASVAQHCADRGFSFGLVSNAVAVYSGKWVNVHLSSSSTQIGQVLEALAMVGPYAIASLPEVLSTERNSLPPGTTVVIATSLVTTALAEEIREIKARGYQVIVVYTGDAGPDMDLPEVPVYLMGQVLEEHEPVLAK